MWTIRLLGHITATAPSPVLCLSEDFQDFSADDEDDLFETLSLPPNFSMDPLPSDVTPLQPLNPLGHQFVGKYIYYKWPQTGWCGPDQGVELRPLGQGMATSSQFRGFL